MRLSLAAFAVALAFAQHFAVVDAQGVPVAGVRVEPAGQGALRVSAPGFESVLVASNQNGPVVLYPVRATSNITVTATPGLAEHVHTLPQLVLLGDAPKDRTAADALAAAPNTMLQQTGAGQVSPFLRGLTGYHVLNLIDGVRFNNATFRSGPNQYLAYVEPSQASRVEAMLGPSGTQYGSDGLGGTIHILTESPRFAGDPAWHGGLRLNAESADLSGGASADVAHSTARLWWQLGAAGTRHNDLRAGRGFDSHNVLTRLYGYSPEQVKGALGGRLVDTAYSQAGAHAKFALRPSELQTWTSLYQRGYVGGVRNTKDLWGGLGRLRSDLTPQILDLFYTRYERLRVAGFDSLSGRFSLNRQQDGSVRQGQRATDAITTDSNTVQALGYSGQAISHIGSHTVLSAGAELYDERISSSRQTNGIAVRPLYPSGSRYRTGAVFGQAATEWRRLRLGYGVRYSKIHFTHPATSQHFDDWTWNASAFYKLTPNFGVTALGSRGFRAPNLNDLSAIGLNDLGFEVPAREAPGALLADSSGEGAVSKGQPLRPLGVERLRNLEAGLRAQGRGHTLRLQFFDAELSGPIARRTLLFPAAAVPASLAGFAVTPIPQTSAQRQQGVVTVATAADPRALKAFVNDGRARYWGVEALGESKLNARLTLFTAYSFLLGRDLDPNRNIRRLPPQQGSARLLYRRSRFWLEGQLAASGVQDRLSGGDRDDERIGASRRRADIADFYNARRFPVAESLRAIQDRVLPGVADTTRVTLFQSTPGWAALHLRGGLPLTESLSLEAAFTNLADRNYRIHGSGIDAPGFGARLAVRWMF
ncbi:MAG: TonB-dependent receptor [Acidobacteria bacterium]|nr:TonB-dependent receptor [Acidobacteriota bacterium]